MLIHVPCIVVGVDVGRAPTWGSAAPGRVEKCRPPKSWVKAKSNLSGWNYFITMQHQAGVNFANFTEVKFRDILLTGPGHQDKPRRMVGPTLTKTQNLNLTSGSFVKDQLLFLLFTKSATPGHYPHRPAPLVGALDVGAGCRTYLSKFCILRLQCSVPLAAGLGLFS